MEDWVRRLTVALTTPSALAAIYMVEDTDTLLLAAISPTLWDQAVTFAMGFWRGLQDKPSTATHCRTSEAARIGDVEAIARALLTEYGAPPKIYAFDKEALVCAKFIHLVDERRKLIDAIERAEQILNSRANPRDAQNVLILALEQCVIDGA